MKVKVTHLTGKTGSHVHAALLVSKHLPGCVSHALQEGEETVSSVRQEPIRQPGTQDSPPKITVTLLPSDTLAVLQGKAPAECPPW